MSTDNAKLTDAVTIEVNGSDAPAGLVRPADSAAKAKWLDYAVGLGADRAHTDGLGLTGAELRELADRLGG